MGAKGKVNIVGFEDLTREQRQFIRSSGASHKDPKAVEELAKLFRSEFTGTRLDLATMRAILRRDQRRRRGGEGTSVELTHSPPPIREFFRGVRP